MRALQIAFILTVTAAAVAVAQPSSEASAPSAIATRLPTAPTLDGVVAGDASWDDAPPATGFLQVRPFDGEPASERTEVRIGFTDDTLYIGVICFDREPEKIIVSDSRRDASLREGDSFQVILDTFLDRRNGFVFGTNPAGIEYDGQVVNEGAGGGGPGSGGQQGGAGGGFNVNWDGAWDVAATIGTDGWSAEFAIPFSTLRYPRTRSSDDTLAVWGINFQRNIRRHNETSFWAPLDRQFDLYRLSDAGTLEGLDLPPQRNLQLVPYVLGSARELAEAGSDRETDSEIGIDLKYSLTPSLTLDASYNTDFAQVEIDEQQVNLDRFSLFFPEKRPFFLENAGLFTVGSPGEVELFFSRRIGIGEEGQTIPILGGARLSGRVGGYQVGLLHMRTDAVGSTVAENGYSVARVRRELRNRSSVGLLVTDRRGSGSRSPDGDDGQTYAVDGRLGIGENLNLSAFAASTESDDAVGDHHAYQVSASYNDPDWRGSIEYTEVADGFDPQVGFLSRSGFRRPAVSLLRRVRPKSFLGFHELRPHFSYRGFWDFDGFQESGFLHVDNHWEWRNGYEIHTGVNFTREGVKEPFEIAEGVVVPAGTYDHEEGQLVFFTNQGAPVAFQMRVVAGGFFGGDRRSYSPTITARWGETLTSEIGWRHNDIDLPGGAFETNLGRLRLTYAVTSSLFVQALVQYNDVDDDLSLNLRLSWIQRANTGLFVVYNERNEFGRTAAERSERSLIVKFSRLFDLLD